MFSSVLFLRDKTFGICASIQKRVITEMFIIFFGFEKEYYATVDILE